MINSGGQFRIDKLRDQNDGEKTANVCRAVDSHMGELIPIFVERS